MSPSGAEANLSGQVFLDTNILLYAYDYADARKQLIARNLVRQGASLGWSISAQVLAEFASTRLHKFKPPASPSDLSASLIVLSALLVVAPDLALVRRAINAHMDYGIHFYDGMIVAAAERAGCTRIYSEDLNAGQVYFGVEVVDPFV